MTTAIITISPKLLVDTEGAYISYCKGTLKLNQNTIKRSSTPFSEIRTGKFGKLFDRHTLAYKH